MNIIYTKSYDNSLKKLKKHQYEYNTLLKIEKMIRLSNDFNSLCKMQILKKYNFERLKYKLSDFYSFNLCKNGGTIRLIVKPNENNIELYLIFISYKHYDDFSLERVIYYE